MNENAEITYNPYADPPAQGGTETQFRNAQDQLMGMRGVTGVGKGAASDGAETLVVYVNDQESLSRLPATFNGMRVQGHVTGEVKALGG